MRFEHRIDARVWDSGNRRVLGGLERRETCVDERIGVRLGSLDDLVDVRLRLRIEVNADETIAVRALGQHGRRLAP